MSTRPVRLLSAIIALGLANAPTGRAIISQTEADDSEFIAAPEALDPIGHIPESNPYRAALTIWLGCSPANRSALEAWIAYRSPDDSSSHATLNDRQHSIARQIAYVLTDAASGPATSAEEWPLKSSPRDPDDPTLKTAPEIGPLRDLAGIATKLAGESPPGEAIPLYAAIARLGREARHGSVFGQYICGIAIENIARADIARRLNEFSPAELETLSATLRSLPAAPGLEVTLETERDALAGHFLNTFLRPGAQAYFDAGEPALDTLPDDATANEAIARLRLSALVDFGDGDKRITLENRATGEFFTVSPTRPAEGVELIDFDVPNHRATIRVHGRAAIVNLQTREIVAGSDSLKNFLLFLKHTKFAEEGEEPPSSKLTRRAWLDRVKNHPDGPDGYFDDALAHYDATLRRQVATADQIDLPDPDIALSANQQEPDPVLAMFMPGLSHVATVARTVQVHALSATMLEAAIRHRLGQATRAPADPWSVSSSATSPDDAPAAPFTYEATPDGGFTLASRYQRHRDEPVTYKFAAPDAGSVRRPATTPAPAPTPTTSSAP